MTPNASSPNSWPTFTAEDIDANGLIRGLTVSELGDVIFTDCIHELGWVDYDHGIHVPPQQESDYTTDEQLCSERVESLMPDMQMSEANWRERFQLELKTRSCLIAQGFSISEPPSEQLWVESAQAMAADLWLPYAEISQIQGLKQADLAALLQACPDPGDRFYH